MPTDHLEDLRAQARYARERYQLYKAKTYGSRDTSEARLAELQRFFEQAQARLRFAEAEEQRLESAGETHGVPVDTGQG
jgi:hypothetical protein